MSSNPGQQLQTTPPISPANLGLSGVAATLMSNDSDLRTEADDGVATVTPTIQPTDELDEIANLQKKVDASKVPDALRTKLTIMINRLRRMAEHGSVSTEYETTEKYIQWVTQIPFGEYTSDNLDLKSIQASLDGTHFGLWAVKEKILEYISVLRLQNEGILKRSGTYDANNATEQMSLLKGNSANAPVVLFVGVQGIGKTSITKSIANAIGRKMVRIPLGALADSALIKGRPKGYPDSEPGLITKALIRSGVMNPLILLDEIDKVAEKAGARAELMASLLEILDPEQNSTFMDIYVDYPIDLSKCMIVCTANNLGGITAAVLDRLEVIRLNSYTDEEKKHIAKDYLLPKVRGATGISEDQLVFADDVWDSVIRPLGFDAGVRQLERTLTNLSRKIAKKIALGEGSKFTIGKDNFREFIPEDIGVYS